jgi:hypothetical protein
MLEYFKSFLLGSIVIGIIIGIVTLFTIPAIGKVAIFILAFIVGSVFICCIYAIGSMIREEITYYLIRKGK